MKGCVIRCIGRSIGFRVRACGRAKREKKAGVVENPQVLDHAGLLFDGPSGMAEVPFV